MSSDTCSAFCRPEVGLPDDLFGAFTSDGDCNKKAHANIRPYDPPSDESDRRARVPAVRARHAVAGGVHAESGDHRRALRIVVRRVHRVPGAARRAHRQRVDSDRRAGDLGAEETRRIDDPRKQHRADDRIGRRIGRRRRRLYDPRADLPAARRPRVLQLLPDRDARVCRRHSRRPDDGAAAARADRQRARRTAVSRGRRVRRRADRRRTRRQARIDGVCGRRHRRPVEGAVLGVQRLCERARLLDAARQSVSECDAQRRHLARIHGRRLRHRPAHRRHDVRRRRALVARAAAAAVDSWRVYPCAVPADPSEFREQSGDWTAVQDPRDERGAAVERLHPVHRRGRRAGGGAHHPRENAANDHCVCTRRSEGVRRRG